LGSIATNNLIPGVDLKCPDTFREETCSDEVEKACRDYEEYLKRGYIATTIARIVSVSEQLAKQA